MPTDNPNPSEPAPSTILLVEPDILVRITIADYLRSCGYKVFEGVTADDAMTVLGTEYQIDFVLVEVLLSGSMDGFALAQWIRQNHPGVDVVLTSGIAKAAQQAADLCDEGPLEKPHHPREVVRRINILRERRRTASQA